jgi:serine/threonine protein phosphatase PrpC
MRLHAAGMTDIGSTRTTNEDAFGISNGLQLYIVADGMGGHAAGEVASKMAVDVVTEWMASTRDESEITLPFDVPEDLPLPAKRLTAAIKLANQKIHRLGQEDSRYTGMGTTVVAVCQDGNQIHIAHAGDSRAYLIRSQEIRPLTRDHSLVKD